MAMQKKWASHPAYGNDPVARVDCEPAPDMDTHGRAWYVPSLDAYVVFGVHLFDTEEEARAGETTAAVQAREEQEREEQERLDREQIAHLDEVLNRARLLEDGEANDY